MTSPRRLRSVAKLSVGYGGGSLDLPSTTTSLVAKRAGAMGGGRLTSPQRLRMSLN